MSPETLELLQLLSKWILGVGAAASTWFVIDYFRTADLRSYFSRMLLTLNAALAVVLWMTLAQHYFTFGLAQYIILLAVFGVVDLMLIAQIFLLHKARRDSKRDEHPSDDSDSPHP